jgi:predicted nucleotidyltransferase
MNERDLFLATTSRVASALEAVGVRYVVTGSMAAGFFGTPRMSGDIDFVIDPRDEDAPYLAKVLAEDFTCDPEVIRSSFRDRSMFQVIDPNGIVKCDLMFRDRRIDPDDVFERSRTVTVAGAEVRVIAPEDLIIAKLLWAKDSRSVMQLRDVHGLLHYKQLDKVLVQARASELGISELLDEAADERYES